MSGTPGTGRRFLSATGMIRINSFGAADPNMPFGGVKESGYGREHGGFELKEFVNVKAIFLP